VDDQLQDDEQHLVVSDALRRYWLPITVATVIFGLIGGIYAYSRPTHYTASAKVLVRAIAGNPLSPDSTSTSQQVSLSMTTEAGVVNSPAVVKIIGNKLDKTLRPGTSVIQATVVPNTEILEIKYTANTASEAESGAQASADSFLEYRESRAKGTVAQTITRLNAQIRTVQAQLKHAAVTAGQANAPINAASQLQIYASRLESLQASVQELQVADPNPGTVLSPARRPSSPASLNPLIYLIGAALFGLGLSIVVAVWRARNDERVRGSMDAAVHGLPVLAALPRSQSTLIDVAAGDELNEAFRRLRTGVLVGVNRPAVIVVSSMSARVRSGPLAANLGLSLADAGFRVCVVDAEIEWSLSRDRLGAGSETTLAKVLADEDFHAASLDRDRGIGVIPAGPDSAGLRDQLASSRFRAVIQGLRRHNDYVVVAAPPASLADGGTVALASDQVIMAVVDRRTTRDEVYSIADRFGRLGVHIMGLIVTPRPSRWRRLTRRGPKPRRAPTPSSTAGVSPATSEEDRNVSIRRRDSDDVPSDAEATDIDADDGHETTVDERGVDDAAYDETYSDGADVDQEAIELDQTELEQTDKKAVSTGAASRDE
jgi:succinoglycan biosynthesis transport protein ExoP